MPLAADVGPGDVTGPVAGEEADERGAAADGRFVAAKHGDLSLALEAARQPAEMIEDERDDVVDGRPVGHAAAGKFPASDHLHV